MPFGRGFASLKTGTPPVLPARDDIVYEAHLRGLTQGDPQAGAFPGTYASAAAKIAHLTQLGINAIEFMPIHETDNEAKDLDDAATSRSATSTRGDTSKFHYDITGTGNTTNSRHPRVRNLIVDSLLYQRRVLGVDSFRFDLGIALVNTYDNKSNPNDSQRFRFDRSSPETALA